LFIGTPKGINLFYELYESALNGFLVDGIRVKDPEWTAMMYRVDETGLIDEKELTSARANMSPAQYRQEWLCDFSASSDDVLTPIDLACQRNRDESYAEGAPKIIGELRMSREVLPPVRGLPACVPLQLEGGRLAIPRLFRLRS
jgi:hypothetical protein